MILITGGAGYIGSHVNKLLAGEGFETLVFDNLSAGHREFVKWGKLVEADLADEEKLDEVFANNKIEAVIHFAALASVPDSVADPAKYYWGNVVNTLKLLKVMINHGVKKLVFSSSAATFGNPRYTPIDELHPQEPINPYGWTKLMMEKIYEDYDRAYGLRFAALRYFNACGADPEGEIGEWHQPEGHLIPLILDAAMGKRESAKIFGTDYPTPDGTAIRDYIHVADLAEAHLLALRHLLDDGESLKLNLGNGKGYSVREVIEAVRRVTGKEFKVEEVDRRAGDPAVLIASSKLCQEKLGWVPEYTDLDEIVRTAWEWHQKLYEKGAVY